MNSIIQGRVYENHWTKDLLRSIPEKGIALIWHKDLDGLSVDGLLEKRVKAVINRKSSMSGRYEQTNVLQLIQARIPVYDVIVQYSEMVDLDQTDVLIMDRTLFVKRGGKFKRCALLKLYNEEEIDRLNRAAKLAYPQQLSTFVKNTLVYAEKECEYFIHDTAVPASIDKLKEKEVLIVARGTKYEADLLAVKKWISKRKPYVVAVDGAADGLLNCGLLPDYIIGDMDSVSEAALRSGATLICHKYLNGPSPGLERLQALGLNGEQVAFVGMSEDLAIHIAYRCEAEHLYLIGCRFGMNEFLEKGRAGMGASMLCRIQAGDRITDLKGIHRLKKIKEPRSLFSFASIDWKILQQFFYERFNLAKRGGYIR